MALEAEDRHFSQTPDHHKCVLAHTLTHTHTHTTFLALEICTRAGTCQTVRVIFRALFSLPTGCVFDGTILGKPAGIFEMGAGTLPWGPPP